MNGERHCIDAVQRHRAARVVRAEIVQVLTAATRWRQASLAQFAAIMRVDAPP
jgi:hypothetical protein